MPLPDDQGGRPHRRSHVVLPDPGAGAEGAVPVQQPVAGREDNQRVDSFAARRLTDGGGCSYGVVSLDHHVEAAPGELDAVEPVLIGGHEYISAKGNRRDSNCEGASGWHAPVVTEELLESTRWQLPIVRHRL